MATAWETDTVTARARVADAAVLIQYLFLVVSALFVVRLPVVRQHVGNTQLFYLLLGAVLLYLCARAYLTLVRRLPDRWGWVWPLADVLIASVFVRVTGGLSSVAGWLYLLPLALCSIQHRPRRALAAGVVGSALYVAVTYYPHPAEGYWMAMGIRLVLLAMVTSLVVVNAAMEAARVEEMVAMREQLALADYRQRLSQEMHDGIQHYLVSLTVRLERARQMMAEDPVQAARVAVDQRFIARQASDELRSLVRLLRSPIVDSEGFVDTLRHHLSLFSERSAISALLHVEGAGVLPPEMAHAALRILQEALTNAEKHARARTVDVALRFDSDAFECTVSDDGVGFDPAAVADAVSTDSGFGLRGMKQRADSVGGWLRITSQPGFGTAITFGARLGPGAVRTQENGSVSPSG